MGAGSYSLRASSVNSCTQLIYSLSVHMSLIVLSQGQPTRRTRTVRDVGDSHLIYQLE